MYEHTHTEFVTENRFCPVSTHSRKLTHIKKNPQDTRLFPSGFPNYSQYREKIKDGKCMHEASSVHTNSISCHAVGVTLRIQIVLKSSFGAP